MKNLIRKFIPVSLALVLLFVSVSQVFAASIISTRFSLYRSDGPMYLDFRASCSSLAEVDVISSGVLDQQRGPLNGTWRVWLSLKPRTQYELDVICQDTSGHGTAWKYRVWFSGSTMRIYRTRTWGW